MQIAGLDQNLETPMTQMVTDVTDDCLGCSYLLLKKTVAA